MNDLLKAAKALVEKLDAIHADSHYQSVWTSYAIHGGDYSKGPKYEEEFAALKKEIEREEFRLRFGDFSLGVADVIAKKSIDNPDKKCHCRKCNPNAWWFIVCETCGNKRCPNATDHELQCTNSNELGQKGSVFEGSK